MVHLKTAEKIVLGKKEEIREVKVGISLTTLFPVFVNILNNLLNTFSNDRKMPDIDTRELQ